jgi:hypothetical protein
MHRMSAPYPPDGSSNEPTLPNLPGGMPGGMPGAMPPSAAAPAAVAAPPKKSRRGLWITLSIILVILIILGGGGYYAFAQYTAPGNAAAQFCNDLKAANYTAAYGLLSSDLTAQFTQDQFTLGSQELDTAEGKVTGCGSTAYSYSLFGSTATVTATLTRTQTYTGAVHLKNQNGAWKVSGLDTSLLGANLGALKVAAAFCAALQAKDYSTATNLFDANSLTQQGLTTDIFSAGLQAHDAIDGVVTGCTLTAIASGNTDTTTTLTVSITRATLGARTGQMTLTASGGTWKISSIATELQGTDIGPLLTATQLCVDLVTGNLASAYQTLTSTDFKSTVSQAAFVAYFTLKSGETYVGCTPDLTTYKVVGTAASFDATLNVNVSGTTVGLTFTLVFVQQGTNWLLEGFLPKK